MSIPGSPEEFEFHVDNFSGTGKWGSKIKFAGIVPHSNMEYESTLKMTTATEDQTVETTLNTKMTMALTPNK